MAVVASSICAARREMSAKFHPAGVGQEIADLASRYDRKAGLVRSVPRHGIFKAPSGHDIRTDGCMDPHRGAATRNIVPVGLEMNIVGQVARLAFELGAAFQEGKSVFGELVGNCAACCQDDLPGFLGPVISHVPGSCRLMLLSRHLG